MNDGLPSNTVYSMTVDDWGYVWLGTDQGVVRYNGKAFGLFSIADGLPDNTILDIKQDNQKRIWFATFSGELGFYKNRKFYNSQNTKWLQVPIKTPILRICLQQDGSVILIPNDVDIITHFIEINDEKITVRKISGRRGNILDIMKHANENTFDIIYEDQVSRVDKNGRIIDSFSHLKNKNYLVSRQPDNTRFFFSKQEGIFKDSGQLLLQLKQPKISSSFNIPLLFDSKCFLIGNKNILYLNNKILLDTKSNITAIIKDVFGNYWVSTNGNGIYFIPANFGDYSLYHTSFDSKANFAQSSNKDFFLFFDNGQLSKLAQDSFIKLTKVNIKLPFPQIVTTNVTFNNTSFRNLIDEACNSSKLGSLTDKVQPNNDKKSITTLQILKRILFDTENTYLSFAGRIFRTPRTSSLNSSGTKYYKIFEAKGRIYASTIDLNNVWYSHNDTLYIYSKLTNHVSHSFRCPTFREMISHNSYLIGITEQNQLLICSIQGKSLTVNAIKDVNCIYQQLFPFSQDQVIISTNKQCRLLSLPLKPSLSKDGFKLEIIENPIIPSQVDYMVTNDDICVFLKGSQILTVKKEILKQKSKPPRLIISDIVSNNHIFEVTNKQVDIPYNDSKNISVYFENIASTGSEIFSETSINGDAWLLLTENRLNFNRLNYGTYQIRFRSKTVNSNYSEIVTLKLVIASPAWARWWFRGLIVLLIIICVWISLKYIISQQLKRKEKEHIEEMRYRQVEYRSLNALMNPHFIFNCMNNIQSLVNKGDIETANNYLVIFSKLVRQNMHNISQDKISLQREITLVNNYIHLQKLRFKDLFNYEINIENGLKIDDVMIPPLIIQPLVENSIIHGLIPKHSVNGFLHIHIYKSNIYLIIAIKDNGVGIHQSKPKDSNQNDSMGLSNLQMRLNYLQKFEKVQVVFNISEYHDSEGRVAGTKAEISLALLN